jgi:hypothetical protein
MIEHGPILCKVLQTFSDAYVSEGQSKRWNFNLNVPAPIRCAAHPNDLAFSRGPLLGVGANSITSSAAGEAASQERAQIQTKRLGPSLTPQALNYSAAASLSYSRSACKHSEVKVPRSAVMGTERRLNVP